MKAESKNRHHDENKMYAREFHAIKDKKTILAYDIENIRLIKLNGLEFSVLKNVKENPESISGIKKRFANDKGGAVEEAVNELIKVDMLGYSSYEEISRKQIYDVEKVRLETLKEKDLMQIVLNITHRCNLNCDYCYGEDGSYGGPAIHMSKDTAKHAVDFLMKESRNANTCRITFFGGEPLLNFDLVKYVVKYARGEASKLNKKMLFNMATNGSLLDDDKIDFLIKENIEMSFSFDGPKKIHDKNRRFKANREKSTYDIVFPKILKYIEKAKKNKRFYAFRATVTRPGVVNIDDMVSFFNRFKPKQVNYDIAEYKHGISPGGLAITDDDLILYRQKVKEIAREYEEDNLNPDYDLFSGSLKAIIDKKKTNSRCISPGALLVGVSAEGDIFPCHRFVGYKKTKLGNVREGFDREKWLKRYAKVHIFNSKRCSSCWIRYFCGGLCPATSYFLGGDMVVGENVHQEPVHCKVKKIVFEEAMLIGASLYGSSSQAKAGG